MKKILLPVFITIGVLLASGCSSVNLSASKSPNVKLADIKTFRVEKLEADTRGIDKLIVAQLKAMGRQVVDSESASGAVPVDAIVTYQDRWMWDLTMYMIELQIQLRAPDTKMTLASGRLFRTTLIRKSPAGMVEETLTQILQQQ